MAKAESRHAKRGESKHSKERESKHSKEPSEPKPAAKEGAEPKPKEEEKGRKRSKEKKEDKGDDKSEKKDKGGHSVRIVTVGDGAVGKTSMLMALKGEPFTDSYVPTIFETMNETRTFKGKTYVLHLWDTAGQEEYDRLRPMSYAGCNVVLICFALDQRISLDRVTSEWVPEARHYARHAPIILVGTKLDLWDRARLPQAEIDKVVADVGAVRAVLCSAKTREGIDEVFDTAVAVRKKKSDCRAA